MCAKIAPDHYLEEVSSGLGNVFAHVVELKGWRTEFGKVKADRIFRVEFWGGKLHKESARDV